MAKIEKFEDLKVWQLAREICNDIWYLFENSSLGKDYELKNQMSRSSGSIMDNIAEGFERNGNREFIQYLSIAKGSCGEIRSQLYRALDRKHLTQAQFENIALKTDAENKKLGAFMSYLNSSGYKGSKFNNTTLPATQNPKP
jgi:four helix bundle protein